MAEKYNAVIFRENDERLMIFEVRETMAVRSAMGEFEMVLRGDRFMKLKNVDKDPVRDTWKAVDMFKKIDTICEVTEPVAVHVDDFSDAGEIGRLVEWYIH